VQRYENKVDMSIRVITFILAWSSYSFASRYFNSCEFTLSCGLNLDVLIGFCLLTLTVGLISFFSVIRRKKGRNRTWLLLSLVIGLMIAMPYFAQKLSLLEKKVTQIEATKVSVLSASEYKALLHSSEILTKDLSRITKVIAKQRFISHGIIEKIVDQNGAISNFEPTPSDIKRREILVNRLELTRAKSRAYALQLVVCFAFFLAALVYFKKDLKGFISRCMKR